MLIFQVKNQPLPGWYMAVFLIVVSVPVIVYLVLMVKNK